MEPLWTAEDVAAYLQVPVGTIYSWNTRDAGPPRHKIGKYLRYRKADVDTWLDQHEVNPAHPWAPPAPQRRVRG